MTEADQATVQVRRDGDVTVLTLHRPAKRNALNTDLVVALEEAATAAAADGARVLVLTGDGPVFCAGADLSGDVYAKGFPDRMVAMLRALESLPVPIVAAVDGPAIGAGAQIALAADLRVVGPTARVEVPVAKVAVSIDTWTVRRLAALIGDGPARSVLMGAESVPAEQLLASGFGNRAGGLDEAIAWAHELAALAPLTLKHLKMVFNHDGAGDEDAPEVREALEAAWNSRDAREARTARAERRAPRFEGR